MGHALLEATYHIVREEVAYADLGGTEYEERDRAGIIRRAVAKLKAVGVDVRYPDNQAQLAHEA